MIHVLVLRAPGINCDEETAYAWQAAGATPHRVHVHRLRESPRLLDAYQVLTVPGGFSYGDDIASGKILANLMKQHLADEIAAFVDRGGLILGICNGFQVLVQMGLLPGSDSRVGVALTHNTSGRYEDRWVLLRAETDRCAFVESGKTYFMPVAHGEGRIATTGGDNGAAALAQADRVALRYISADGTTPSFPENPNGSIDNIAGLTDSTGRVFGLMPHPERAMFATQRPVGIHDISPEIADMDEADGLCIFRTAVRRLA